LNDFYLRVKTGTVKSFREERFITQLDKLDEPETKLRRSRLFSRKRELFLRDELFRFEREEEREEERRVSADHLIEQFHSITQEMGC